MDMPARSRRADRPGAGRTLVETVRDALREQIAAGAYSPGSRLPSEAQMTKEFGVSRTVIREAVASLRADGLVAPHQGAGFFVPAPPAPVELPFQNIDFVRISSMIELLELRTAVVAEAAALARAGGKASRLPARGRSCRRRRRAYDGGGFRPAPRHRRSHQQPAVWRFPVDDRLESHPPEGSVRQQQ